MDTAVCHNCGKTVGALFTTRYKVSVWCLDCGKEIFASIGKDMIFLDRELFDSTVKSIIKYDDEHP